MKKQSVCVVLFVWLCWGCQSDSFAPPPRVTSQMVAASGTKELHADIARLSEGRTLFVHRCIECHTLPAVWHYRSDEWPGIVGSMSHRASLKPAEREAIVAYILTVRSQH
jgi:hypothetical protein